MKRRHVSEAYMDRQITYQKSGGVYMSTNMSRKQYMQLNPMFDRLKNIETMMKKATPVL